MWLASAQDLGAVVSVSFFVIPSVFILWGLSYIYVALGNLPWIASIFYGLKPAVLAIVAAAVIRIGSRALKNEVMWTVAATAFIAIYFFHVPSPLIIISAALIGFSGGKWKRDKFLIIRGHRKANSESVLDDSSAVPDHAKPSWPRALGVALVWVILWSAPVLLLSLCLGSDHTVVKEGIFFSKAALVTFGGAYAVLPYVAQQAVQTHHWLSAGQDAGWTRSSGNNTGALDQGDSIRRLYRRLEPSGAVAASPGRHDWRFNYNMDDVYSLLFMDLLGDLTLKKCAAMKR